MRINRKQAREMGIVPDSRNPKTRAQNRAAALASRNAREDMITAYCVSRGLPVPIFEHRFHDTRRWRFDLLFEGVVAVEICGGVWKQGHHSRGQDQLDDWEKWNTAQMLGYLVLLVSPQQIEDGSAFVLVQRALSGDHA